MLHIALYPQRRVPSSLPESLRILRQTLALCVEAANNIQLYIFCQTHGHRISERFLNPLHARNRTASKLRKTW